MTRFKELRKEIGLTQEELLQKFNQRFGKSYTAGAISQFENGHRTPETQALIQFADFFNVTLDYLLGRSNHRNGISQSITQIDTFPLSGEERQLIQKYRQLDEKGKITVSAVIEAQLQAPAKPEPAVATAEDEQTFRKEANL